METQSLGPVIEIYENTGGLWSWGGGGGWSWGLYV